MSRDLTQEEAEKILLKEERHPNWIKEKIWEDYSPQKGFGLKEIYLTKNEFDNLVYNSKDIPSILMKEASYEYKNLLAKNSHIDEISMSIMGKGWKKESYLLLRELYFQNDLDGSYYIDNGLHRTLAFANLLYEGVVNYTQIPAVVAFRCAITDI